MRPQNSVYHLHDQLIPAKVSLPPHRSGIIRRKQVFKKLEGVFTHRLVLVSAPAGYGKTTLVSDWLATQKYPVAWISLTKGDNQVPTFLSYLSAALKQIHPSAGHCIDEVFHQQQPLDLPSLGVSLLHELDQITPAMVFVLDDFHLIENPQIHELVQFLLQNSCCWADPETAKTHGCHPILITRHDPPFPVSKWRIDQEIVEIRIDDLKFSLDETGTFLRNTYKQDVQPDFIDHIATMTEGWVTGLQLAVLSVNAKSKKNEIIEINAENQLLVDYLMEEVIQTLPEEIQHFLVQTSILEHMTADLCDQIRGKQDSRQILEWLVHENLFILPMDNQQGWYRFHQLFLDVLVHRQYLIDKDTLQEYHSRAAKWLERKGYYQASLLHWLAAGNIENAARMLEEAGPVLMNTSQLSLLRGLCDAFPENSSHFYPWVSIYRAWSYVIIQEDMLNYWLDQSMEETESEYCRAKYSETGIAEMQGNIIAIRALHEARFGEIEETISLANRALSLLPANAINIRGLMLIAIAKIYIRTGDLSQASSYFQQAITFFREGGNLTGLAEALFLLGRIYHHKGKLKAAYQYYGEAVSLLISNPGNEFHYSYLSFAGLGLIELEWHHLEKAEEYLEKAYAKRNIMGINDRVINSIARIQSLLKLSKFDDAKEIVTEVELYLENPMVSKDTRSDLIAWLIIYYSLHRDPLIVRQIIDENSTDSVTPEDFHRECELVGLAYHYWKSGEYDPLIKLVDQLLPILESSNRIDHLIQLQTLYAVALFQMGDVTNAVHHFSDALNRGLREGYFLTYVMFGEPVIQLIFALANSEELTASDQVDLSYLHEISSAISQRIIEKKHNHRLSLSEKPLRMVHLDYLADPLTTQENLVLRYLASGNDNQTIAKELRVSNNTIKTHLSNIYSKLGVHSRIEAVNKAKTLGII